MKKEDKELILKDLCARSFYSVKVTVPIMSFIKGQGPYTEPIELVSVNAVDMTCTVGNRYAQTSGIKMFNRNGELVCKPYLRPMSSMTEEEIKELSEIDMKRGIFSSRHLTWHLDGEIIDYLNKKMLDWRRLIPRGLAFEAPEGMYDKKEE